MAGPERTAGLMTLLNPMTENENRILNNPYKSGSNPGCNCKTCNAIRSGDMKLNAGGLVRASAMQESTRDRKGI